MRTVKHMTPATSRNLTYIAVVLSAMLLSGCVFIDPGIDRPGDQPPVNYPLVRFAVFGDAEPKPLDFKFLSKAVDAVNQLNEHVPIDFVAAVGDLAHKGTTAQYEAATEQIERLNVPFYTLMGNEEYEGGMDRFFDYATKWNDVFAHLSKPSYSIVQGNINFVFASASHGGRDFSPNDINWILEEFDRLPKGPIVLFTHPPAASIFPDAKPSRTIQNSHFDKVLSHPELVMVFSGHLHLNLDKTKHYVEKDGVHHIHVPGLERTKVPDDTHTPYFRLVTVFGDGHVLIETYSLTSNRMVDLHEITFRMKEN